MFSISDLIFSISDLIFSIREPLVPPWSLNPHRRSHPHLCMCPWWSMFPFTALSATNGSTGLVNGAVTSWGYDTGATSANTALYERPPRAEDDEGPARGGPGSACGGPPGAGLEAYAWVRLV